MSPIYMFTFLNLRILNTREATYSEGGDVGGGNTNRLLAPSHSVSEEPSWKWPPSSLPASSPSQRLTGILARTQSWFGPIFQDTICQHLHNHCNTHLSISHKSPTHRRSKYEGFQGPLNTMCACPWQHCPGIFPGNIRQRKQYFRLTTSLVYSGEGWKWPVTTSLIKPPFYRISFISSCITLDHHSLKVF